MTLIMVPQTWGMGRSFRGSQAQVVGQKLRLTQDGVAGGFSSFSVPALANSAAGFTATFDYLLFDSLGGNYPADGFFL